MATGVPSSWARGLRPGPGDCVCSVCGRAVDRALACVSVDTRELLCPIHFRERHFKKVFAEQRLERWSPLKEKTPRAPQSPPTQLRTPATVRGEMDGSAQDSASTPPFEKDDGPGLPLFWARWLKTPHSMARELNRRADTLRLGRALSAMRVYRDGDKVNPPLSGLADRWRLGRCFAAMLSLLLWRSLRRAEVAELELFGTRSRLLRRWRARADARRRQASGTEAALAHHFQRVCGRTLSRWSSASKMQMLGRMEAKVARRLHRQRRMRACLHALRTHHLWQLRRTILLAPILARRRSAQLGRCLNGWHAWASPSTVGHAGSQLVEKAAALHGASAELRAAAAERKAAAADKRAATLEAQLLAAQAALRAAHLEISRTRAAGRRERDVLLHEVGRRRASRFVHSADSSFVHSAEASMCRSAETNAGTSASMWPTGSACRAAHSPTAAAGQCHFVAPSPYLGPHHSSAHGPQGSSPLGWYGGGGSPGTEVAGIDVRDRLGESSGLLVGGAQLRPTPRKRIIWIGDGDAPIPRDLGKHYYGKHLGIGESR